VTLKILMMILTSQEDFQAGWLKYNRRPPSPKLKNEVALTAEDPTAVATKPYTKTISSRISSSWQV
jgi:hypothetical protein